MYPRSDILSVKNYYFTKCRPELDGKNGNANTASRNRIVSRLSARFPLLNLAGDDGYIGPSFPLPLQSPSPRKLPL